MKRQQLILLLIAILIVLAVGAALWIMRSQKTAVNSFDDCVKSKGSTLLMTYPEQCVTSDKKTFTQPQ